LALTAAPQGPFFPSVVSKKGLALSYYFVHFVAKKIYGYIHHLPVIEYLWYAVDLKKTKHSDSLWD